MNNFEIIVRKAFQFSDQNMNQKETHVFEERNIHQHIPQEVRRLFDNAHYSQATFEACKYLDKIVAEISGSSDNGKSLMMKVFLETSPIIKLNELRNESEKNEQEGYRFIFAGTMIGIRNPRGHEWGINETVEECLEYLVIISHLIRKIEKAGYRIS